MHLQSRKMNVFKHTISDLEIIFQILLLKKNSLKRIFHRLCQQALQGAHWAIMINPQKDFQVCTVEPGFLKHSILLHIPCGQ